MDRAQHLQEMMEGFHTIQQKMMAKHKMGEGIEQITFAQWRVLAIIERLSKATIKEIHTALGVSSSAATQLVNELVKKKYVLRQDDPNDKRTSTIVLSPKTKNFIKKIKDYNLKRMLSLFDVLNDNEFEQYISLNKKITKSI